jgi:5-deoxy-glucuronate isomerase
MTATTESLHLPAGSAAAGPYALEVTPESAGWGHSSLRVLELPAGGGHVLETGPDEVLVVPLEGGLTVACDDEVLTLAGRSGVFAGPTDFAYLPLGATATLSSRGGASPCAGPAPAGSCRSATGPPRTSRWSCAAPGGAAGR